MDFIKEEFLHKKMNKKEVYVDATEDIPEDVCRLKQYRDLTVLYWSRSLKFQKLSIIKYQILCN